MPPRGARSGRERSLSPRVNGRKERRRSLSSARGAQSTRKRTLAASIDGGWGRLEDPECLREVLGAEERGV